MHRAKYDYEENIREVEIVTFNADGAEVILVKETQEICSGDIIKLTGTRQVPADMLLIYTSGWNDGNKCFIETANLDGETNLKVKEAPTQISELIIAQGGKTKQEMFTGYVDFEQANRNMHNFVGALKLNELEEEVSLAAEHILLRGSLLSNTDWVYGIAIYTGQDTKIQMNNTLAPTKLGKVERYANVAILIILGAQIVLTTFSVISIYLLGYDDLDKLPYVYVNRDRGESVLPLWLELWFIFFLLYINFIPISLYVTMELTNIGQAYLMSQDLKMYCEDLDEPCCVKSSSLVQEPGIVSHIFSDKTGTLTRNEMKLVCFVLRGKLYNVNHDGQIPRETKYIQENTFGSDFLKCLLTCHTVVKDKSGKYRAESPDELALVEGIMEYDCTLAERGSASMSIKIGTEIINYKILAVNAFNADRKRMSVLLHDIRNDTYRLMCKGADSEILKVCDLPHEKRIDVNKSLLTLAQRGLRTLCVSHRNLTKKEATKWLAKFHAASTSMVDRDRALSIAAIEIETKLHLLGVTAIEDRLQDEVPEVIRDLKEAGIVLWMLTGDKEETAKQIGRSCNLITPETNIFELTRCDSKARFERKLADIHNLALQIWSDEALLVNESMSSRHSIEELVNSWGRALSGVYDKMQDKFAEFVTWVSRGSISVNRSNRKKLMNDTGTALVVDGFSFKFMDFTNDEQRKKLLDICEVCQSVIGCRLTPIQKQQLVNLVKTGTRPSATCLSIGDGANDVSMIREANVGVGIYGKEGRQAANNADFAIGQFKFLRRLCLLHGRWNYMRQAKVFLYSMHKNICIVITLFWFIYLSAVSGVSPYESWMYSSYNLVLGLPIIIFGFMDKDSSEEFILGNPSMYGSGKQNIMLSKRRIFLWISNAVVLGIMICLLCYHAMNRSFLVYDLWSFGCFTFVALVNSMHCKMAFMHHQWTLLSILAMVFSVVFPLTIILLLGECGYGVLGMTTSDFEGTSTWLFKRHEFWLFAFFTIPICIMMIEYTTHGVRYFLFPQKEMLARDIEQKDEIDADEDTFFEPLRDPSKFSFTSRNSSDRLRERQGSATSNISAITDFDSYIDDIDDVDDDNNEENVEREGGIEIKNVHH